MRSPASGGFRIFGHRGAPLHARENSIRSIELALDSGADGVEVDARRLTDGTKVLFHDAAIDGRLVEEFTFSELRAAHPDLALLDDAIDLCRRSESTLIVEVKAAGWESELAGLAGTLPGMIFSCFVPLVLRRLREGAADAALGVITDTAPDNSLQLIEELGLSWFFPASGLVDDRLVARARTLGASIVPWTPNTAAEWEHLERLGCAGIITDAPDLARVWRSRAG